MGRYEKIKNLCKERGITITGLERELGFARGSLSKIDKNQPSADRLEKLSAYFNLPVGYFLEVQTSGHIDEYYQDKETAKLAQEMFEDPDMRALFHMKKNMEAGKFKAHMNMMKELYKLEHPEEYPEDDVD